MQEFKSYIEDINNEFVSIHGGSFVKIDTGEMFTKAEVKKYTQLKLEQYVQKNLSKIKQISYETTGVAPEQNLINNRSTKAKSKSDKSKEKYDGGDFNIVYREKIQEVVNMKLTNNEKLVYYILRDFIVYPSNSVRINEKVPTFPELEIIIGFKDRALRKLIKSLETKGLVKLVQHGHRKEIFINPEYYASGKDLNIETLQLFNLIEVDEEKLIQYISEDY